MPALRISCLDGALSADAAQSKQVVRSSSQEPREGGAGVGILPQLQMLRSPSTCCGAESGVGGFTHEAHPQVGYLTRRDPMPVLRSVLGMASVAVLAGMVSTVLFAVSTLPMLIKAARTKELASYSRGNLVLANIGNAVHSIYVVQLPAGPIWALHTFYVLTSGLMLIWHLRYAKASPRVPNPYRRFP